jgi:hypothetical protein
MMNVLGTVAARQRQMPVVAAMLRGASQKGIE